MDTLLPASLNGETLPLVLIVDDDGAARDSLAAVIEAFGFRTRTACNGVEGLEMLAAEIPSAIVTDLHMPEMDGFALMDAVHSTRPGIPVIAISGAIATEPDVFSAAKHRGAVATFPKPLAVLEVIDTISGLITRRAA
jgi:CheY-like chemotaxis protein